MRLLRLEAHDFAQYADLDLDLSGVTELAIVGENEAGKSQLMNMTVWSLYGRTVRGALDDLIRDGQLGTWVKTTWDDEGSEVVVLRVRSIETRAGESSLALQVDGERQTRHTIAETQAVLTQMLGLTYEQLLATVFAAQKDADRLMVMTPAKQKALVNSLLELDRFEPWRERASAWRQDESRRVAVLDDRIADRTARLEDLPLARKRVVQEEALRTELVRKVATAEQTVVGLRLKSEELLEELRQAEGLGKAIEALNVRLEEDARSKVTLEGLVADQGPRPAEPEPFDRETWAGYVHNARQYAAQVRDTELALATGRSEVAHAIEVRSQVAHLCDVCPFRAKAVSDESLAQLEADVAQQSEWLEANRQMAGQEPELVRRAQEAKAAYEAGRLAVEAWDDRQGRVEPARRELAALIGRMEMANGQVADMNRDRMKLLQRQAEAEAVAGQLTAASQELRGYQDEAARAEAVVVYARDVVVALEAVQTELEVAVTERDAHAVRAERLGVVEKMFHRDGLPSFILGMALPQIEGKANELLARMPGELALRIDLQTQTKTGEWRDEMDVAILQRDVARTYDTISGAMQFRVDLAYRLGLGNVLLHRVGKRFRTLWLDEAFSAQSKGHLQEVLDSLSGVVSDYGLSLFTTHQDEVADRIPAKLAVVRNELGLAEVSLG